MSSMLKKTGGLAFKPKVGRRPGAASASQAPASQSTTRAPTTEPSQAPSTTSTPAAPTPSATPSASEEPVSSRTTQETVQQSLGKATTSALKNPAASAIHPPRPAEASGALNNQSTFSTPATVISAQSVPSGQGVSSSRTPTRSGARAQEPISATTATIPASTQLPASAPKGPTPPDTAPRHPLPQSTSASQASAIIVDKETPTASTTTVPITGLPSPTATAISQSSATPGGSLPLPPSSSFPASDQIPTPAPSIQPDASDPASAGLSNAAPKKKRQYRKRKQPGEDEGTEPREGETAAPKPKRPRKKKVPTATEAQSEAPANGEVATSAPKRSRRRQITPDPEDIPEDGKPDHATTKIGDLTRDLGIGKKFKHADVIMERQRQARHQAKMRKLDKQKRAMGILPSGEDQEDGSRVGTPAGDDIEIVEPVVRANRGQGIDFDIIDGQIMINQSSLVINQHAVESNVQLETVEEDEFTHLTTSNSYLRPSRAMGPNHWDEEETELFYKYLKMFGTDFETISHMFPGKARRQVKLKFNREEKLRPNRVNAAIMARGEKKIAIDLDEYKANRSGFEDAWITPDKFRAEQEALQKEQEKELEAKRQERRDLGLLDDEPGPSKTEADGDENVEEIEEIEEIEEEIIDEADVGGAATAVAA